MRLEGKFALQARSSVSRGTQPPRWDCRTPRWTSSQTLWPGQGRLIRDAFVSGAGSLTDGVSSRCPCCLQRLGAKCRDVLPSPFSAARVLLPPCSSQPADPSAGWDAVESVIFKARRKLLPPLPGLLDGGGKAFGIAGGYSPTVSCWHAPPKTEMGFLRPAGEMCLFLFLVHAAVGLTRH